MYGSLSLLSLAGGLAELGAELGERGVGAAGDCWPVAKPAHRKKTVTQSTKGDRRIQSSLGSKGSSYHNPKKAIQAMRIGQRKKSPPSALRLWRGFRRG